MWSLRRWMHKIKRFLKNYFKEFLPSFGGSSNGGGHLCRPGRRARTGRNDGRKTKKKNKKRVEGDSGQEAILRSSNHVTETRGVWKKLHYSYCFAKKAM